MAKKILLGLAAVLAVVGGIVAMSAFEAHVVNVTARIENALEVLPREINFGTVFPQEYLVQRLTVALSHSFMEEGRVDDVNYIIKQKPKPINPEDAKWCHENLPWDPYDPNSAVWAEYLARCYYPLCSYLSKIPDDEPIPNDEGLPAFHQMRVMAPAMVGDHWNKALGHLAKSVGDIVDIWTIDLDVPCFEGYCAQDWDHPGFELPPQLESAMFGCDLWIEVTGISEVPPYTPCEGWSCLDGLEKDFFVTGRYGNQSNLAQTWELAIWEKTGGGEVVRVDDGSDPSSYDWGSGVAVDFSLSYNPSDGSVVYTVGGKTLNWTYSPNKAFSYIIPFAKGDANGNNTLLSNLVLDGINLPDLDSGSAYKGLIVPLSDAQQSDGFSISGKATLTWGASPVDEKPAFHMFAMDTHDLTQ